APAEGVSEMLTRLEAQRAQAARALRVLDALAGGELPLLPARRTTGPVVPEPARTTGPVVLRARQPAARALPETRNAPPARAPAPSRPTHDVVTLKCRGCGGAGGVGWGKFGQVLQCQKCSRRFVVRPDGQAVEVVRSRDGRWRQKPPANRREGWSPRHRLLAA